MDRSLDPRSVFTAMHQQVTAELLHLMDGFYSNIEDGLFELAFRDDDDAKQRHCFDLMREMRYRRTNLVQTFAKRMQRGVSEWFYQPPNVSNKPRDEFTAEAAAMAEKCESHFHVLLQSIAQRAAFGTGHGTRAEDLPIGPSRIAHCFLLSCRSLKFDESSIATVQELFGRFILDRLGCVYGQCNQRLERAGYPTARETDLASSA